METEKEKKKEDRARVSVQINDEITLMVTAPAGPRAEFYRHPVPWALHVITQSWIELAIGNNVLLGGGACVVVPR